jgi:hypothetical protein
MNMTMQPQTGAPALPQGNAALWAAVAAGINNPQSSQAIQAQLALMAQRADNVRYMVESMKKLAPAMTAGIKTQPYAASQALTFNLPQPSNSYTRGVVIRTTLAYTLATGTGATYAKTAAGILAAFDTIEVIYNRSQIKFRPLWLRQLALMGAIEMPSIPSVGGSGAGGSQNDSTYLGPYLLTDLPTATGAQTAQCNIWVPFNLFSADETRGLLPSMPGELGIQVKLTPAASLFGPDPVFNAIYTTGGTGAAISAVSGTVAVLSIYSDGESYATPNLLPYHMGILDGTIQIQQDVPFVPLVVGAAQKNLVPISIVGKHYYLLALLVDGNQSNAYALNSNINYLGAAKDGVGTNMFWAVGQATNLDVQDFFWQERAKHCNNDLDQGILPFVEAPIQQSTDYSSRGSSYDGTMYLNNSTAGWPAWHAAVGINTQAGLGAGVVTPRIEFFTAYVNPVGLPPV